MAYVTVAELKEVIQTGDIYPDPTLQLVCDAAENVISALLIQNRFAAIAHERKNNTNILYLDRKHDIYVGQSVVISHCGGTFNGTKTITAVTATTISFAHTAAEYPKHSITPNGWVTLEQYIDFADQPEVHEAALAVAVDIWQTQKGSMAQMGVDFQPAPYRLGRSLVSRVNGLLANWLDTRSMVG
jgi:hypothetical protein